MSNIECFYLNMTLTVEVPKKLRGRTRMDKVHTRPFEKRVLISMNEKFQPVSDNGKDVAELSRFLGTLKRCVPLTYASWEHVPVTLKDTLWEYTQVITGYKLAMSK